MGPSGSWAMLTFISHCPWAVGVAVAGAIVPALVIEMVSGGTPVPPSVTNPRSTIWSAFVRYWRLGSKPSNAPLGRSLIWVIVSVGGVRSRITVTAGDVTTICWGALAAVLTVTATWWMPSR